MFCNKKFYELEDAAATNLKAKGRVQWMGRWLSALETITGDIRRKGFDRLMAQIGWNSLCMGWIEVMRSCGQRVYQKKRWLNVKSSKYQEDGYICCCGMPAPRRHWATATGVGREDTCNYYDLSWRFLILEAEKDGEAEIRNQFDDYIRALIFLVRRHTSCTDICVSIMNDQNMMERLCWNAGLWRRHDRSAWAISAWSYPAYLWGKGDSQFSSSI